MLNSAAIQPQTMISVPVLAVNLMMTVTYYKSLQKYIVGDNNSSLNVAFLPIFETGIYMF